MVTHQMEEVERLCDRVILLKDGTAEAYGTIDEVQNQFGGSVIRLKHGGVLPPSPSTRDADETNYAELSITDNTDEAAILKDLIAAGVSRPGSPPPRSRWRKSLSGSTATRTQADAAPAVRLRP